MERSGSSLAAGLASVAAEMNQDLVARDSVEPAAEGVARTVAPESAEAPTRGGEHLLGDVLRIRGRQPRSRQQNSSSKVALKVIKPGMDTGRVIARFEAERQALAIMDHLHIARVLDAGDTDTGRPFFLMELVKGVPITEYCDGNSLAPQERLELFIPVCQAIQHARQKGIIHRDIKPSNVLVTLDDGKPVRKVIDFGVSRAIDQRLTEKTMFTELGAVIDTPEYMSPEQAGIGTLDIDTRSDTYSLGVLFYEFLTSSTPLERAKLRQAAHSEVLRRIREKEPTKPSTRLSELKDALAAISAQRKMEPARLMKLVRGDLDWIVMKSLERASRGGEGASREARATGDRRGAAVRRRGPRDARAQEQSRVGQAARHAAEGAAGIPLAVACPAASRSRDDARLAGPLGGSELRPGQLTDEIGDKEEALIAYQESLAIRQRLARENPSVAEFPTELAQSHNDIGLL